MQLIMDAEPTADIKDKMSNLDETLDTNLKEPIEIIKNEIANGNKENIESQTNVIESTADIIKGDNLKCSGDLSETPNLTETIETTNEVEEVKVDLDIKTEGICETNNGDSVQDSNGNEGPCDEEMDAEIEKDYDDVSVSNVANDPKEDISLENNVQSDISKVEEQEDKQENETVKVLDNVNEDIIDEVEDTSLSNKEDNKIHTEGTKPDTEKVVKNNSEDAGEAIAEDVEVLDKETKDIEVLDVKITDIEVLDVETKDIEVHDAQSKDIEVLDVEAKDISSLIPDLKDTPLTANETEKEISNQKDPENIEILGTTEEGIEKSDDVTTDIDTFDTEMQETTNNDTISKALEVLDTEIKEIDNLEENSASTEVLPESKDSKEINVNSHEGSENIPDSFTKGNDETESSAPSKNSPQTSDEVNLESNSANNLMDCDIVDENKSIQVETTDKEEILDIDEFIKGTEEIVQKPEEEQKTQEPDQVSKAAEPKKSSFCKLSNTLDILSDDDEEPPQPEPKIIVAAAANTTSTDKQCISIEDDDDIMLIDEDTESKSEPIQVTVTDEKKEETIKETTIDLETITENVDNTNVPETVPDVKKDSTSPEKEIDRIAESATTEIKPEEKQEKNDVPKKPLVAENFLKSYKKNLTDMSRDELEEYCILKIVEGIVDRSNLSDIKSKLKVLTQSIDEYKKKAVMLSKQNRDLQLVLKSVQEEQKKKSDTAIIPLKITRSVGMQVLMTEKPIMKKKNMINSQPTNLNSPTTKPVNTRNINMNQTPRPQKSATNNQIPVPRLVPAATNPAAKAPSVISQINTNNNAGKTNQSAMNGVKIIPPPTKAAEKRTHSRTNSVTVDLTDDEPPTKVTPRSSPAPPVRLVSPQNLLNRPQPQFTQALNSPRKVYIPISGPQGQNIRPGQTIMLKSVPPPGQRLRGPGPHATRMPQNQVRLTRVQNNRHPAPLPECMKQYQPPNWKALPPAPDLKLSKVENGIVISWKIEGYQEDSYEEIASYQLYAYQETNSPPNTALWKKIGDVKALPLPMACTLTQFMAGFKYYFAVRAVDVRSRLGPFSLPGSILLLNKM